jgi:hypothetical protein
MRDARMSDFRDHIIIANTVLGRGKPFGPRRMRIAATYGWLPAEPFKAASKPLRWTGSTLWTSLEHGNARRRHNGASGRSDRVVRGPQPSRPALLQDFESLRYRGRRIYPRLSGINMPSYVPGGVLRWVLGVLGALVAIIEGVQQVYQFHANWLTYRATSEGLKREKFLYLATAGPYAAGDPAVLLAERIEVLIWQENAKWVSFQEIADKSGAKSPEASTNSPKDSIRTSEAATKSPEAPEIVSTTPREPVVDDI